MSFGQRRIKTPELGSFSHWPEIPYRWMLDGLIHTIKKVEGVHANYLIALGLISYSEIIGHEIRKYKNLQTGRGYSKDAFDTFLGEYMGYKELLKTYPIYDWYRCGLCHEFKIKDKDGGKKTGPFHFFIGSNKEAQLIKNDFGADVSKGIVIGSNGLRYLIIEPYLKDFTNGIEKFLKESQQI